MLIVGGAAKSIGLHAAGMAVALGSSRVDYIDSDDRRLRIAERLGANPIALSKGARWFARRAPLLPEGYPIAIDASGSASGLSYAVCSLAPGGTCTALAFYVRKATPLPLWNMYMKSATLHVGVAHPHAHIPRVLALIASGSFDPTRLEPLVGDFRDADRILLEPATKVIVRRERLFAPGTAAAVTRSRATRDVTSWSRLLRLPRFAPPPLPLGAMLPTDERQRRDPWESSCYASRPQAVPTGRVSDTPEPERR